MADFDMDDDFEPQARSRSNTWPVKPRELQVHVNHASPSDQQSNDESTSPIFEDSAAGNSKRGGSRKNAWGNFSYADLISRAIESTPEKRLTLAQIYDWLVQNVPYFKDKGDCNSSAGWKNSIRHNLSLHSRFIRVQNEGTGKSSWWMINPEAKGIKSSRRRTASMDPTGDLLKKRNKAKSRVEELRRAGGLNPALYRSESESNFPNAVNGDANQLVDPFAYGQQEFRMRSGSNASSYGGLSPLHPFLDASPSPGGWGSQQALAGDGGLILGSGNDTLADLWETALTLSAADVDPLFGTNASEQLSLNLFGGADAYLRAPPAYDDPSLLSDIKPQVLMQQGSVDSLQSLNSSTLSIGVSAGTPLSAGLQQSQQQNAFAGIQLPDTNTMLTQQELETRSLINELLADGIKNEAAMRYQYGTTGIDMGSSTDIQPQQQVQQQQAQVQQTQQQFLAFPDQVLGDFKPVLVNGNIATTTPIISSGGELYVLNTINGGGVKLAASPTLVSASYPSLISAPFGTQQNLATPQGIQIAPANGVQNNNVILDLGGIFQQQFGQPVKVQQQNVAGVPVVNVKTEDLLLSLLQRQRQQHLANGGLQLGDIDVSLQELRASGLSCDMEQILSDGNLDLIVD